MVSPAQRAVLAFTLSSIRLCLVSAWVPPAGVSSTSRCRPRFPHNGQQQNQPFDLHSSSSQQQQQRHDFLLSMVVGEHGEENIEETSVVALAVNDLTEQDWELVKAIHSSEEGLENAVAARLSEMHPRLLLTLRTVVESESEDTQKVVLDKNEDKNVELLQAVGGAVKQVLDTRLEGGRNVLQTLLGAGEIRKLDAEIGKASRSGLLDMAFFTVLNMNVRDAAYEDTLGTETEESSNREITASTSRLQILQHIYTRCQEEVEKTVSPGVGLLNKLLRTDVASIRTNQLEHYLGPQTSSITTPDGKVVELKYNEKASQPLVPPTLLVEAIAGAVQQIRTVERAGGTDARTAADLVESCRQVAMEARTALAKVYGTNSTELLAFQDELQPIFRPDSAKSIYIQGN
jgi:hypothetical protein